MFFKTGTSGNQQHPNSNKIRVQEYCRVSFILEHHWRFLSTVEVPWVFVLNRIVQDKNNTTITIPIKPSIRKLSRCQYDYHSSATVYNAIIAFVGHLFQLVLFSWIVICLLNQNQAKCSDRKLFLKDTLDNEGFMLTHIDTIVNVSRRNLPHGMSTGSIIIQYFKVDIVAK